MIGQKREKIGIFLFEKRAKNAKVDQSFGLKNTLLPNRLKISTY